MYSPYQQPALVHSDLRELLNTTVTIYKIYFSKSPENKTQIKVFENVPISCKDFDVRYTGFGRYFHALYKNKFIGIPSPVIMSTTEGTLSTETIFWLKERDDKRAREIIRAAFDKRADEYQIELNEITATYKPKIDSLRSDFDIVEEKHY